MEAHELRLGNYINHISFGIVPIKGILELSLKTVYKDTEYWDDLRFHSMVPISEKFLLDFGFTSNPYNDTYSKGAFEIYRKQEQYFFRHIELKYVHRLQNLFYEWTDQELTIETKQ